MKIVERTTEPLSKIIEFYESQGYGGGANEDDKIILAYEEEMLICVVRITLENDHPILRDMFMREDKRGSGLGKIVLDFLEPYFNEYSSDSYCVPKTNLENFYSRIGYRSVDPSLAPHFLYERMQKYNSSGHDVILMKRENRSS